MENRESAAFVGGMERLGVAFNREISKAVLRVYWETCCDLSVDEFAHAIEAVLLGDTFFPAPARLRELARQGLGLVVSRGAEVFDALLGRAPQWSNTRGDYWLAADVEARFGCAAREAFLAAGGTSAFQCRTDKSLPFLRRDFLAAYPEAARAEAHGTLMPMRPLGRGPATAITKLVEGTAAALSADHHERQLPPGDRRE